MASARVDTDCTLRLQNLLGQLICLLSLLCVYCPLDPCNLAKAGSDWNDSYQVWFRRISLHTNERPNFLGRVNTEGPCLQGWALLILQSSDFKGRAWMGDQTNSPVVHASKPFRGTRRIEAFLTAGAISVLFSWGWRQKLQGGFSLTKLPTAFTTETQDGDSSRKTETPVLRHLGLLAQCGTWSVHIL